jgi:hypothetical protein
MPAVAHHMSNDPTRNEDRMPLTALGQHNLIVEDVSAMGVAQMAGTMLGDDPTQTGEVMDPADMGSWSSSGNTTNPNAFRQPPTETLPEENWIAFRALRPRRVGPQATPRQVAVAT